MFLYISVEIIKPNYIDLLVKIIQKDLPFLKHVMT